MNYSRIMTCYYSIFGWTVFPISFHPAAEIAVLYIGTKSNFRKYHIVCHIYPVCLIILLFFGSSPIGDKKHRTLSLPTDIELTHNFSVIEDYFNTLEYLWTNQIEKLNNGTCKIIYNDYEKSLTVLSQGIKRECYFSIGVYMAK